MSSDSVSSPSPDSISRSLEGIGQRFGAPGLVLAGATAVFVGYYLPLMRIGGDPGGMSYSVSSSAHFGVPWVAAVAWGAGLLVVAALSVIWRGETRRTLIVVLAVAVGEALWVAVATALAVALLANGPGRYYREWDLAWGPALPVLMLGAAAGLIGAFWWCLHVWSLYRD